MQKHEKKDKVYEAGKVTEAFWFVVPICIGLVFTGWIGFELYSFISNVVSNITNIL